MCLLCGDVFRSEQMQGGWPARAVPLSGFGWHVVFTRIVLAVPGCAVPGRRDKFLATNFEARLELSGGALHLSGLMRGRSRLAYPIKK